MCESVCVCESVYVCVNTQCVGREGLGRRVLVLGMLPEQRLMGRLEGLSSSAQPESFQLRALVSGNDPVTRCANTLTACASLRPARGGGGRAGTPLDRCDPPCQSFLLYLSPRLFISRSLLSSLSLSLTPSVLSLLNAPLALTDMVTPR